MEPTPPQSAEHPETLAKLQRQRDLAFGCVVLAAVLGVAMIWENFARPDTELVALQQAAREHQTVLAENQKANAAITAALEANQREIDQLKRVKGGKP